MVQRTKAFLVESLDALPEYVSVHNYRTIEAVPLAANLVEQLEQRCLFNDAPVRIDHVIGTLNVRGAMNISDHVEHMTDNSPMISLSFGGVRECHLRDVRTGVVTHRFVLAPDSAFFLGPRTNAAYQHVHVAVDEECGLVNRMTVRVEPCISLVMHRAAARSGDSLRICTAFMSQRNDQGNISM
jgi:hypothetical protein